MSADSAKDLYRSCSRQDEAAGAEDPCDLPGAGGPDRGALGRAAGAGARPGAQQGRIV